MQRERRVPYMEAVCVTEGLYADTCIFMSELRQPDKFNFFQLNREVPHCFRIHNAAVILLSVARVLSFSFHCLTGHNTGLWHRHEIRAE